MDITNPSLSFVFLAQLALCFQPLHSAILPRFLPFSHSFSSWSLCCHFLLDYLLLDYLAVQNKLSNSTCQKPCKKMSTRGFLPFTSARNFKLCFFQALIFLAQWPVKDAKQQTEHDKIYMNFQISLLKDKN